MIDPPETPTYLLTWNSDPASWTTHGSDVRRFKHGEKHRVLSWRCGHTKLPQKRERFFLMKQGPEPRGIIGSGWIVTEARPYQKGPPGRRGYTKNRVWVRFDVLLDHNVEPVLGWRHLSKLGKASIWNARSSGNQLSDDVAARLEELWKKHTGITPVRPGDGKDDDTDYADLYEEGGSKMRKHREIERSGPLRRAAKAYWNRKMKGRIRCLACTFDFGAKYGKHGREFIELHHEEHLSQSPGRKKKSVKALTPVCSNCHRMIHRYRSKPLTVKQLRKLLAVTASA